METQRASQLARELMEKHGLIAQGWRFEFDAAKRRFGVCRFFAKTIGLSEALTRLNDEATVTNTLLHEIAHALVGPRQGHGWVWKSKACEIGCDGNRCYSSALMVQPKSAVTYVCPKCAKRFGRSRRYSITPACTACCRMYNGNRYTPEYTLVLEQGAR